jgi:hypothetical protein
VRRAGAGVRADPGPGPEWGHVEFAHLIEECRTFRRVGGPDVLEPDALLRDVVAGLFGVRADAVGGRFEIGPWLPEGWRFLTLRRLRCHRTLVDLEIKPRAEWATVRLAVTFGPPIAVALSVRNTGAIARVTVDEVPLEGERAILTVSGEHEAMFFFAGDSG